MSYYLNFKNISLDEFYDYLQKRHIFPSHRILKENMKYFLDAFKELGYTNIEQLYHDIKTKKKCEKFSNENDMDFDYVITLRRHIMSLFAKVRKISDFSLLTEKQKLYLTENNITTSEDLYHLVINKKIKDEYFKSISDLSRMRYVSPLFLDALYLSGIRSIEDIKIYTAEQISKMVNDSTKKHSVTTVNLGVKDSQFLIDDSYLFTEWLQK